MPESSSRPSSNEPAPIPAELSKQLADFQRSLWRIKVTEAVLAGIFGLIISFLIVFALERLFPIPALARLAILIAGTSLAAVFAPYWVRRWVYGHRREEQLARLISRKFPKLGDRLLGIVELQDQQESKEAMSPELRAAAMIHVANQAAKRNMNEALPYSRHKKLALGVLMGAAAITFGFSIAPKAGGNALKRWLMPLSDTDHYTFTQFDTDKMPDPLVVPLGEAFSFSAPLKKDSDNRPANARARYGQQEWVQADLGENGSYQFEFTGQETQDRITIEAGDADHRVWVEPEVRPEVSGFEALVTLPDYLQLDPRDVDIRTGVLTALEGSKIVLKGSFSREILKASAHLDPQPLEETAISESRAPIEAENPTDLESSRTKAEEEGKKAAIESVVKLPEPRDLKLFMDGATVSTEPIDLGRFHASVPFTWTDVKGLDGAGSFKVEIKTSEDQIPTSYIQGIERNIVILAEETLEFDIISEDDFGLREIGLSWVGSFNKPSDDEPATGSLTLKKGSPSSNRLSERAIFSPQTYGIAPQTLILSAYTEDYKPGRGRIFSEPLTIYILTRDEHAQVIKKRFDRVISELEDAARKELNNLDENERLDKNNTAEELQSEEAKEQLAESEQKEAENAEKMKEIAKKMEAIFKDAARNGELDQKTMKEMADALQNMKELGGKDMPEVEKKLGEAQDQKSTPEKTEKDLKEAIEKQKEALEKMQETIEKANQANENFEASTFVNRLKKSSADEGSIGNSLNSALTGKLAIVGAAPNSDDIDPANQRLLGELSGQQRSVTNDVRWIQEDLERFYARTQKPIHKEVYEDMAKSLIDEKLERLREKIQMNHTFTSRKLSKNWSDRLMSWAEKLEGPKPDGNGGGGDGGSGGGEEKDFEFMLKVMRMVQAEQDIRGRTRSLEQMLRSLKLSER
ncbi:hypothetical protein N9Z10_02650 [Akkermansiaceae bacterium]|nr:hypothetical protein [Akkermansiaceae bacterium]MDA7540583.1 hypothetical protein [bacterium]MDA7521593.1 hypothetical protein [Akkermansiaceae bacterium]MDA7612808.1 hypothetical protein [Akkermansiaceae bacterium]MDA7625982.1 hypothetical protein [Akkermansiaceae bacterium]